MIIIIIITFGSKNCVIAKGYCGSCWAFSSTEQIESDSIRSGYLSTSDTLAPQQLVSCDTKSYGCNGGSTVDAYQYVRLAGGIELNASYPYNSYSGNTNPCYKDSSKYVVTVDDYHYLEDEHDLKSYVLSTGPVSICVDASTW